MPYCTILELLEQPDGPRPARLDSIDFTYRGIQFHAYGVLHGLTGGTNRQYVKLVNDTIASASGARLGEKAFRSMYKKLDAELQDWRQVPMSDAFQLGLRTVLTPLRIARLVKTALAEKLTANDPFGRHGVARVQDIGGSAAFHALDPFERRRIAGFPAAQDYLRHNLARRKGQSKLSGPVFPSAAWAWLTHIEPYANIACRSVHMLEYAAEWATLHKVEEVSLFVGEVHNSDIAWLAQSEQPVDMAPEVEAIRGQARKLARQGGRAFGYKAGYLLACALGMSLPLVSQLLLFKWLWSHWA